MLRVTLTCSDWIHDAACEGVAIPSRRRLAIHEFKSIQERCLGRNDRPGRRDQRVPLSTFHLTEPSLCDVLAQSDSVTFERADLRRMSFPLFRVHSLLSCTVFSIDVHSIDPHLFAKITCTDKQF